MPLSYKQLTQPIVEPCSLQVVKQQCVVDVGMTADDNLLTGLIIAARQLCEKKMQRCIFNRTMLLVRDFFPYPNFSSTVGGHRSFPFFSRYWEQLSIKLPKPGCVSVTSITYIDQTGVTQTLDPSTYTVDVYSEPARIFPVNMIFWPWIFNTYVPASVQVTWVAGTYGDGVTINTCPQTIIQAILLLVSHWYSNRDATATSVPKGIEMGVDALLLGEMFDSFYGVD
jgi:uncharacterized phiE125 gp8 family phage protein